MIHKIVQAALRQRFLVLMFTAFITIGGILSFQRMPVDAYPDLAPPQVEIISQWPGHAAEEVERLVTLPLELEMNGVPHMVVMRSISLYGLSDVILTFEENTDSYFARQIVFERLADATVPTGVTPGLAPLFSPSGLVYRYVLQSPDRTPQELKTIEDWVVERAYHSVHGVADDSGFGGTTMQYQVLLDPTRLYGYHLTIPQVGRLSPPITRMPAADSIPRADSSTTFAASVWCGTSKTLEMSWSAATRASPSEFAMSAKSRLAMRLVSENSASRRTTMRLRASFSCSAASRPRMCSKGSRPKPKNSTGTSCRQTSKFVPFYDRSELVALTTDTVEANLLRGMILVLIVLIFFLVSFRAAVIVALTIPLSLLFAFIVLHAHDVAANLLSIGAIDFGIVIDGTVVMIENIYRELALREGQQYNLNEVILAAAKDVDRPIFYSVAVILAGYLPIYALSGPSGKLFHPMAETMSFALVGALILTLTLIPVLASYWFKRGVQRNTEPCLRMDEGEVCGPIGLGSRSSQNRDRHRYSYLRRDAAAGSFHWRRIHASPGRRRALGAGYDALHDFVRGSQQDIAADTRHPHVLSASHRRRFGARTPR